jgi:hypothetical protein
VIVVKRPGNVRRDALAFESEFTVCAQRKSSTALIVASGKDPTLLRFLTE